MPCALPRQKVEDAETVRFTRLRALPFFADFHDIALWVLMRLGNGRRVPRGTALMREGAAGDSFCMLIEGQVGIYRQNWELSTLDADVTFGEMTFLRPDAPIRTATAVSGSEVLVLNVRNPTPRGASDTLQSCFDKAFIKLLAGRLVATNEQVAEWDLVTAPPENS